MRCIAGMVRGLVASLTVLLQPACAQAQPQAYTTLVFNAAQPGQDAEFNRWYDEEHLPDVLAVPGFVSGQRFRRSPVQLRREVPPSPEYLVVFTIVTDDLPAVYAELRRRSQSGETRMSPSVDRSGGMNLTYLVTDAVGKGLAGATDNPLPTYRQVVLADAEPGGEEALDRWYRDHHAAEIAAFPGFTGYRLGTLSSVQMLPTTGQHHMALFNMDTADLAPAVAKFRDPGPMTPGPKAVNLFSVVYEAVGPLVLGEEVRAIRAAARKN